MFIPTFYKHNNVLLHVSGFKLAYAINRRTVVQFSIYFRTIQPPKRWKAHRAEIRKRQSRNSAINSFSETRDTTEAELDRKT